MTVSTVKIQDKDTQKRLSVVQSKDDPTKWGVVILNPDGSPISPSGSFVKGPDSSTDGDIPLFEGTDGHKIKDSGKKLSDFVDITSNQTVDGVKTFQKEIILPAKTTAPDSSKTTAPATEAQVAGMVSDEAYGSSWDNVNGVAPSKNAMYDKISSMDTAISNKADDNSVVKLTGNQTIQGIKTFGTNIVIPSKSELPTTPSNTAPATEGQVKSVKDAIPAVENVLTSTSTTNALSAAQGKVLNDSIGTINGKIPTEATSSNKLADKNYVNDSINSITAYYITKNAQGDQFATYAELSSATTFYSGGVVRTPTRNDYCIVLADENHDNACTRYIYQNNQWEFQYVVNETALTQAQLDALNSGITAAKVSTYDGYASGKQDALTTQTAYTTKGTATKVPTITTNTLGQVTAITETNITFPVTSVNGSTGSVTVSEFNPGGTATTGYVLKKTADGYGWDAESGAVTSVNGQTGAVTVNEVPSSGTTGYVLTKTSSSYAWQQSTGGIGISTDANNILTSGASIRVGTESNYQSLANKNSNTIYLTI